MLLGKCCAERDGTYQIGENLKTGAQEEKEAWNSRQAKAWREFEVLAWILICIREKVCSHAQ